MSNFHLLTFQSLDTNLNVEKVPVLNIQDQNWFLFQKGAFSFLAFLSTYCSLFWWFWSVSKYQNDLDSLLKHLFIRLTPRVSDSVCLCVGTQENAFLKVLRDADASDLGSTLKVLLSAFCKWRNWGVKDLSDLSEVAKLVKSDIMIWAGKLFPESLHTFHNASMLPPCSCK